MPEEQGTAKAPDAAPAWDRLRSGTDAESERERCAEIASEERDRWLYGTSGYTAANLILRKIRGEL
jgi:hypothetical protein